MHYRWYGVVIECTALGNGYPVSGTARTKRSRLKRANDAVLGLCCCAGVWFVTCSLSGWRPYFVDLSAQLGWRWWIAGVLAALVCFVLRRVLLMLTMLCLVIVQLVANASVVTGSADSIDSGPEVKIAAANLGPPGRDSVPMLEWILAQDPDIIALVEAHNSMMDELPSIYDLYPYRIEQVSGMRWSRLILSKHPIEHVGLDDRDEKSSWWSFIVRRSPTIVLPSGQRLTLSVFHSSSPRTDKIRRGAISRLMRDGASLARWHKTHGYPIVAVGDFNSTPLGAPAIGFGRSSGLRVGSPGLAGGTWPSWLPRFVSLPIDLGWHSEGVSMKVVGVSPKQRGDHRAVVYRARIANGQARNDSGTSVSEVEQLEESSQFD